MTQLLKVSIEIFVIIPFFFLNLFSLSQEPNEVDILHLVVINYSKIFLVYNHHYLFVAQVTPGLNWAWLDSSACAVQSCGPGCRSIGSLVARVSGWRERRETQPNQGIAPEDSAYPEYMSLVLPF